MTVGALLAPRHNVLPYLIDYEKPVAAGHDGRIVRVAPKADKEPADVMPKTTAPLSH